jgi:hypothetical protein
MESMGVRTPRAICIRIQYDRNNGDVLSQLKKNPIQNILATIDDYM